MNFKEILLGIAIFILTLFVVFYGFSSIYPTPQYEDYCSNSLWRVGEINETTCFELGGKWTEYSYPVKCLEEPCQTGYCEQDFACRQNYDLAQERHSMNSFLVFLPLGIILLLIGAYFLIDFVGLGIMAAGVGVLIRGVLGYWRYTEDWLRFVITLIGLIILIYFSYKFKDRVGKKRKKKG